MSRPLRIVLWTLAIAIGVSAIGLAWPSLLGCLMVLLLVFGIADYSSRRYRSAVRTFNSAVRAVCRHDGAINKVALAFSRSGPLSGPCYEYARRLMMGEDPLDAAVSARVPIQLRTAVAMQTLANSKAAETRAAEMGDRQDPELAMVDTTMMPAYAQFIYLSATALITCSVLGLMGVFVVPTLERIFQEFYDSDLPYRTLFSSVPALSILFGLAVLIIFVIPLLNRGHLMGIRLPRCVPMMPRPAERKAEILFGLADGIDAGWPLGRALATGHTVSRHAAERGSFEQSMRMIQQGVSPIQAIHRVGWIDADETAWMEGSAPQRTADLLRTIGDQNIRDARSNLRWMMAIIYPVLILLLGTSVLAYAYGFFATLSKLISVIA